MTAVAVEIMPRRPTTDDSPPAGPGYFTRPVQPLAPAVTTVTAVADMDSLMEGVVCSCNAGDDNPH